MIQITKNVFNYNQTYKIDNDEQRISMTSEYDFKGKIFFLTIPTYFYEFQ